MRRKLERIFVVLALSVFSWALIPLLQYKSGFSLSESGGNPLIQALVFPTYLVTGTIVLLHWRRFREVALAHKPTLALVALALASVAWSTEPALTVRRSVALLGTTLFGLYLVTRFDDRELLKLLAWTLGPAALLSLAFSVALPEYGQDEGVHAGAWRGIYPDKNSFGRIMVLSTLVFTLLSVGATRRRWVVRGGALLSAALVALSTSGSATILLIGMLALTALYFTLRWTVSILIPWLIGITLVGAGAALLFITYSETLFALLGKDPTLTGRTDLWQVVLSQAAKRPLLGHGYSGFWLGESGPGGVVWRAVRWKPPHSHNGFLDLWLDLGIVGVALFVLGFALAARWAVRKVRATRTSDGIWPMLFLTFTLLYNLTESTLLQQNNIFWVLYVAAVAAAMRLPAPEAAAEQRPTEGDAHLSAAALSPGVRRRLRQRSRQQKARLGPALP